MNRTFPRPRRHVDVHALALDAPAPLIVTCAGMRLAWPFGHAAAHTPDVRPAALCAACGGYADACQCSALGTPPPDWKPDTDEPGPDLFASDDFDAWPTFAQRLASDNFDDRAA